MSGQQPPRVIIGAHDSVAGRQALRRGLAEARRRQATVHLVRAYPAAGYLGADVQVELAAAAAGYGLDLIREALGRLPDDLLIQAVGVQGAPGQALVGFADRDGDLLVVGDGQRHGWRRVWSGSVARTCVRRASCPVLVVPPPALARTSCGDLDREMRGLIGTS